MHCIVCMYVCTLYVCMYVYMCITYYLRVMIHVKFINISRRFSKMKLISKLDSADFNPTVFSNLLILLSYWTFSDFYWYYYFQLRKYYSIPLSFLYYILLHDTPSYKIYLGFINRHNKKWQNHRDQPVVHEFWLQYIASVLYIAVILCICDDPNIIFLVVFLYF